ncbi:MAG: hydroxyphenylacetyl-CoA thioesterase PaaI [Pseudomonadota bacterium]|jgi:acyl-CoA thioesterase|nr:hydroxyphenylacetyl-CoA thioesterase PaaI [Oxalobacteraceae bacterium]
MSAQTHQDAAALARAAGEHMYARDRATQGLGIELLEVRPGYARMEMKVRNDMLNGHAMCHGGFIFTLADSTFAFACNSYNVQTVAAGCTIEFLTPAFEGERLQAEAIEQSRGGKTGIYDVVVTNPEGRKIALMRGKSHQLKGAVVE